MKRKILAVVLILLIALSSCMAIRYAKAPKIAENVSAVYLSKHLIKNDYGYKFNFLSFSKTYHTVKISKSGFVVEIGGTAKTTLNGKTVFDDRFSAKVLVPFFGRSKVKVIKVDGIQV